MKVVRRRSSYDKTKRKRHGKKQCAVYDGGYGGSKWNMMGHDEIR